MTGDDPNRRGQSRRFEDELLRWHAAGSGEVLSVVDSSGDLSYVSRAAERLLGWSPEELLGKPATSLYHPDDLKRLGIGDVSLDRRRVPRIRCRHRDGSWLEVETQMRPLIPNLNQGMAVVVLMRDVTRETRALQDLRTDNNRLRRRTRDTLGLLDNLPLGVLTFTLAGRVDRVNAYVTGMLGLTEEQLVGRTVFELVAEIKIHAVEPIDTPESGGQLLLTCLDEDGQTYQLKVNGRATGGADDDQDGVMVVVERTHGADWEQVTQGPAAEHLPVRAELQEAKREFLRTISHELRTPLTSILGFTDLIATGTAPPAARAEAEAIVHDNARALLDKIDDLLLLAALREGETSLTPVRVDIVPIVRALCDDLTQEAQRKSIRLIIDMPRQLEVMGSPHYLTTILRHLVRNAIRFSDGGHISIGGRPALEFARFAVEDGGPGIGEWDQEWLFEEFTQIDQSMSRRHDGMGIGLSLVRLLVEAHRGVCGAENRDQGGTMFWFTLPRPAERTMANLRGGG
ncbi:MAG: PAS domain-containing sensor histidine kinase [Candidatus Dormibacteria bacterium]